MIHSTRRTVDHFSSMPGAIAKDKDAIHDRIEETGVVPALRGASAEDALFVAEALTEAGLRILECQTIAEKESASGKSAGLFPGDGHTWSWECQ